MIQNGRKHNRGDPQLGRGCGAFLTGAFFSRNKTSFGFSECLRCSGEKQGDASYGEGRGYRAAGAGAGAGAEGRLGLPKAKAKPIGAGLNKEYMTK